MGVGALHAMVQARLARKRGLLGSTFDSDALSVVLDYLTLHDGVRLLKASTERRSLRQCAGQQIDCRQCLDIRITCGWPGRASASAIAIGPGGRVAGWMCRVCNMYNANGVFVTCSHLEAGRGVSDVFCVFILRST